MSLLLDRLYHLHWVTPEAARSAQPYLGFYGAFLKPHGFKSLINLRGENPSFHWWRDEKRIADAMGIAHFDVRLSSRNLPSRSGLAALFAAFERAPLPLLLKCSGGQDRASLGAALYLLHSQGAGALSQAKAQFAFWPYLHRPKSYQFWLQHFPAFAAERAGSMQLSAWARQLYDPRDFAAWLEGQGLKASFRAFQAESHDSQA